MFLFLHATQVKARDWKGSHLVMRWVVLVCGYSQHLGWDPCGRSLVWLEAMVSCLCHTLWNPRLSTLVMVGCRNSSLWALAQSAFLNNFTALVTPTADSLVGAHACVCSRKVHAKKLQQSYVYENASEWGKIIICMIYHALLLSNCY